jgi:hypothetical protein
VAGVPCGAVVPVCGNRADVWLSRCARWSCRSVAVVVPVCVWRSCRCVAVVGRWVVGASVGRRVIGAAVGRRVVGASVGR